jgi:hypothetical protein
MCRHFLSRLRHALSISINNVVFRKPTHIYRSDASDFGVGGYNLVSGKAWRFEFPTHLRLRTSLNSLEFLACIITIWIDFIHNDILSESCILSQTDNTSAAGWLRKSNFSDEEDLAVQLTAARHLASLIINNDCCLYSQWFSGDFNTVSDCLSHDFHLSDNELTSLIISSVPHQVPFGFYLSPIPTEFSSWLTYLLQNQPSKEEWCREPMRSKLSLGADSKCTSCPSESKMIGSSTPLNAANDIKSWEHSLQPSEKVDFLIQNLLHSEVTQSDPPWTAYLRPSDWLTDPIQDSTSMATLRSFYNANLDVTKL